MYCICGDRVIVSSCLGILFSIYLCDFSWVVIFVELKI